MSEWRIRGLGELVESAGGAIRTGPFGSQLHANEYVNDLCGVPVVMPKDMRNGRISRDSVSRVSEATAERLGVHRLIAGDLVLARRGDIGRLAYVAPDETGWICGTGSMRIHVSDHGKLDPQFLRYAMSAPSVEDWLVGQAVGATMPNLNAKIVSELPIAVPGVGIQGRIAAVLSAFDQLGETNERRIRLLEGLAHSLYREWFMDFRFPGHKEAKLVDSELGPIPAGWEVRAVGEVLDLHGGGTPSKKRADFWDGQIPWFTPSDLTRTRRRFATRSSASITALGLEKSSARLFPPGSVLMTSRATLGVLAISAVSGACNQGFIVVPPTPGVPPEFVYEWLRSQAVALEQIATGATFKEITKGAFKRFPILVPQPHILKEFASRVLPLNEMIMNLETLSSQFAAARGLLLSRLVTGQLDISDIDLGALTPTEPE